MRQNVLDTFFPVPTLLRLVSVGLDISDHSIKFVELKPNRKGLSLSRYGVTAIPEGILNKGHIIEAEKLVAILSALKKKEHIRNIRVSLPEEQLYLFKLRIPLIPINEIHDAVLLQLEEHIPINASEAVFDYTIIEQHDAGYDINVSALSQSVVASYLDVFLKAGLTPISFESESIATARALIRKGDKDTIMIVDFGDTRTGISIASNEQVLFTTTIDIGGHGLMTAVAKTLNIPFAEAEKICRMQGLSHGADSNQELFGVLLNNLSVLRDEISRNYIYWHTHKDEAEETRPKIQEILLCGGNANLIGLTEYLSASLRIPVHLANPWVNTMILDSTVPDINNKDALAYTTALGLALSDFE